MYRRLYYAAVWFLIKVAFGLDDPTNGIADTIEQCVQNSDIHTVSTFRVVSLDHGYYLFNVSSPITWCQAYHFCIDQGYTLATIQNENIQRNVQQGLQDIPLQWPVWIGGRRKDFGRNWTWVNKALTGKADDDNNNTYELSPLSIQRGASMFVINGNIKISNTEVASSFFCAVRDGNVILRNKQVTWITAQNLCHSQGGSLVTLPEIGGISKDFVDSWIGLYRNPWIWVEKGINGRVTYSPVIYSVWNRPSPNNSCMSIDPRLGRLMWNDVPCQTTLGHVLCQDDTLSVSNDHHSGDMDHNILPALYPVWTIPVAVVAVVVLSVFIIVIAVCVARCQCKAKLPTLTSVCVACGSSPLHRDDTCNIEMDAYKPGNMATPNTTSIQRRSSSNSLPRKQAKKSKLSTSNTFPMRKRVPRKFTTSTFKDATPGVPASFDISLEDKADMVTTDVYSVVNKNDKRTSHGEGETTSNHDELGPNCNVDDDVTMFDNENYGDVESPYEYAMSALAKKPIPGQKPLIDSVINNEELQRKCKTLNIGGARPKNMFKGLKSSIPQDVYAEVDKKTFKSSTICRS